MAEKLNKDGKQQRLAGALEKFIQQYARKAHPRFDPNDRGYDRKIEQKVQRMKPEVLDKLLRLGDDDT